MNYTAKEMLSDWLGPIDGKTTPEINAARNGTLKKIVSSKDPQFWLNLVKLSYGLEANVKDADFVQKFKKDDESFPLTNNTQLLKALAAIALCYKLESGDSDINHWLSLAIFNCNFSGNLRAEHSVPFEAYALENIQVHSRTLRSFDFNELSGQLPALQEAADEDEEATASLSAATAAGLLKLNVKLYEELNILWWMFAAYSQIAHSAFRNTNAKTLAICIGRELADLTKMPRVLETADQFFIKALDGRQNEKSTLYDAVNSLSDELKKKILVHEEAISEFTPVAKAIKISREFAADADWSTTFQKQTFGNDAKKETANLDIAIQFYRELLFLRLSTNGDFK